MFTKAVIQTDHKQEPFIGELSLPNPDFNQVIVKLYSSGICHSQLHQIAKPGNRPQVFGHEGLGVVTHIGKNVDHVKEGDLVIVTWVPRNPIKGRPNVIPCGATYNDELVHGQVFTWAEDALIFADYVVKIPDDSPKDLGCIVGCAVLTGAGAVMNTAKVKRGNTVAVFGAGGVGLSAIKMASILEASKVIVVDIDQAKLDFAKKFGATDLINASEYDPVEKIIEITEGGVDFSFDAIGIKITNEQILPITVSGGPGADNHGGMAVLIGMPGNEMTIDPGHFMYNQRIYRGSLGATYPQKDFEMFFQWHKEGIFPLDQFVTKKYKLEDFNQACKDLREHKIFGRSIIEF
ncbi:MAG: alcohol dehydrogenase [Chloroflexota bacterium]|jgi:Zn-dependent alcohol dehydrogenase|nr:alcohol dehydrogenase [Chloroflexota bacterium]MCH2306239.1 zinc-binding dehydrogenase [SAR202 cluster bacterium]GIS68380.1 MAG: alcohol dehydrogenase [Chloroflexota bacterium]|tara:strand:- start:29750 stop:30796 length:1047 start_codon:yes stop_codon:yes gene_type:complete